MFYYLCFRCDSPYLDKADLSNEKCPCGKPISYVDHFDEYYGRKSPNKMSSLSPMYQGKKEYITYYDDFALAPL